MNDHIIVKIDPIESLEVEKLFFEYNALISILAHLSNNNANEEFLDKKLNETVKLYMTLEEAKNKYSNKYQPNKEVKNYAYNFEENSIVYYV